MHSASVYADNGLGQEGRGEAHPGGDLTANKFVDLNLVGSSNYVGVAVVDLELRGRDFRVILFVLEPHGALNFRSAVDKCAERVAGQRVVIAAGVHVLESLGFVIGALRVLTLEQEALDFIGGVEGVTVFLMLLSGITLENAADVSAVRAALLVDHLTKDEHFSGSEDVGGSPIKCRPIDPEPKVAFPLGGEAADRGTI